MPARGVLPESGDDSGSVADLIVDRVRTANTSQKGKGKMHTPSPDDFECHLEALKIQATAQYVANYELYTKGKELAEAVEKLGDEYCRTK